MRNASASRFILCLLLLAAPTALRAAQPPIHSQREFKIGVLISLTGSWSSLGHNTVAALQIAADQLAADAKAQHGGYRFHLFVRDT